ncbi:heme-copper oxidase subunit III [Bremerella cremea]|uniref:Heme-copper oxidase subunit III n=1 Tax=Bremerella cremea TaxID=1031537 RepID=A0A368KWU0_9BACT|nr:cytochrome c oxidase subunit 3 [Bremerella cremea]RCS54799.1 heme-copper oxidase subunit III [Bremerella cremea]
MLRNSFSAISMRREEYQAKFGFALFIASLTMFFLAGLVAFIAIGSFPKVIAIPVSSIPWPLTVGTLFMLGVSFTLHQAVVSVRREKQLRLRQWLWASVAVAIIFIFFQTIGLSELLESLAGAINAGKLQPQFGVVFFLVFVHGLHVIGGMLFLRWVIFRAYQHRYDHESHWAVDLCALYWHFLDVVWIVMLGTFLVTCQF